MKKTIAVTSMDFRIQIKKIFLALILLTFGIAVVFMAPILHDYTLYLWGIIDDENKPYFLLEMFGTLATISGGIILLLNYLNSRDRLAAEKRQNESRLSSERFTRAVELLGHERKDVRVGAIYSLMRLAIDFSDFRLTTIDILVALIHERSREKKSDFDSSNTNKFFVEPYELREEARIDIDVQASLKTINYLRKKFSEVSEKSISLDKTYLVGADLSNSNFRDVSFKEAILVGSDLSESNFSKADFRRANLDYANASRSEFYEAKFEAATCKKTNFLSSNLEKADLENANFESAYLRDVSLRKAIIAGTIFNDAHALFPEQLLEAIDQSKALLYGSAYLQYGCAIDQP